MKTAGVLGACLLALASAAAQQARDTPARNVPAPGAAMITGLVRDGGGQPLRRAIVALSGGPDGGNRFTFVTDDDGTFLFSSLAAGSYRLSATKPGYVKADYGAKRPARPGTAIALADGQRLTGITLTLQRGAVITGRLTNELGEPARGTTVRLMQSAQSPAGRALVIASGSSSVSADDRGIYRFFGLAAGEYFVAAMPVGSSSLGIRLTTADDVTRAEREVAAGTRAGVTGAASATPAPTPSIGSYAPVLYPGVTTATAASPIVVGVAEERNGIDFRMALSPTARVEGAVTAGGGLSEPIQVLLLQPPTGMPGAAATMRATSAGPPDGRFSFSGVAPGDYVLVASVIGTSWAMTGNGASSTVVAGPSSRSGPAGGGGGSVPPDRPWAMSPVVIAGRDVSNVVLPLQPALSVSGRLVFDGRAPHAASDWSVSLEPATDITQIAVNHVGARVAADGRFTVAWLTPGRYTAYAVPTTGLTDTTRAWALSSVVVGGRDVTETGVDVAASTGDLIVTLTDRVAELTGVLQNVSGQPAADYTILLFTADRALWRWQSRRILTTRPATDGRFTFRGMPPGNYFLAALSDVDENQWFEPAFLEPLVPPNSIPVTISDGSRSVQDVRIAQ